MKKTIFLFVFLTLAVSAYSQSFEQLRHISAELVNKQTEKSQGLKTTYYLYKSPLSERKLAIFYSQMYPLHGWQEVRLKPSKSKPMGSYVDPYLNRLFLFRKGDQHLSVSFMPGDQVNETYIRLILREYQKEKETKPTGRRIKSVPVFKGAEQFSYDEIVDDIFSIYKVEASIDEVRDFYKESMLSGGWRLLRESAPEVLGGAQDECETCPGYSIDSQDQIKGVKVVLDFKKALQNCSIDVYRNLKKGEIDYDLSQIGDIIISVDYHEKK